MPARMSWRGNVEDAPVNFLREMLGLQKVRHAVEGVVVDEDRAQQRLLRLDVVGGEAVGWRFGALAGGALAKIVDR